MSHKRPPLCSDTRGFMFRERLIDSRRQAHNVRVQVVRAVTRNPRRTKLVEKSAIPRSPATNTLGGVANPNLLPCLGLFCLDVTGHSFN